MLMTLVAHVEIVHIPKNNLALSIVRWPNLKLIVQLGILCKERGKSRELVTIIILSIFANEHLHLRPFTFGHSSHIPIKLWTLHNSITYTWMN